MSIKLRPSSRIKKILLLTLLVSQGEFLPHSSWIALDRYTFIVLSLQSVTTTCETNTTAGFFRFASVVLSY